MKQKLPAGMWLRGNTYYARFRHDGRTIRKKLSKDYGVACRRLAYAKMEARGVKLVTHGWTHWSSVKDKMICYMESIGVDQAEMIRFLYAFEKWVKAESKQYESI